jgi:carbonic anhydrase
MSKFPILIFSVVLALSACRFEANHNSSEKESKEKHSHWSYQGETSPEHWAEIEKNSDCGGMSQSPINIIETDAVTVNNSSNLEIYYSSQTLLSEVENNGHSIQFDFETGDSILYNNEIYYLKQIHFHEPAEHLINGIKYPLEIHLVHASADNKLTVIGILGMEGKKSDLFEFFKSFLPLANGETKEIHKEIDLTELSLESKDYFSYTGSLTTPPCSENVNWIMIKEPLVLSLDEVNSLKENMPVNNYRNEQALNGRKVYFNQK